LTNSKGGKVSVRVVNFPQDELQLRARNELLKENPLIIDCNSVINVMVCQSAGFALSREGFTTISLLLPSGYGKPTSLTFVAENE
jgi:hypothetical protein